MGHFVGIIHKDNRTDYGVCFPDFPGCISAGRTLQEAYEMGQEALQGHIAVMQEYGDPLPKKPMTLDAAAKHPFASAALSFFVVTAEYPSKLARINITMEESLIKEIDMISRNRSAFLTEAARLLMDRFSTNRQLARSALTGEFAMTNKKKSVKSSPPQLNPA